MALDDLETPQPEQPTQLDRIEKLLQQILDFLTSQQKQQQSGLGH